MKLHNIEQIAQMSSLLLEILQEIKEKHSHDKVRRVIKILTKLLEEEA